MVTSNPGNNPVILSRHIVGLDLIRVLACLGVVAVHFGLAMWVKGNNPGGVPTHAFDFMQPFVAFGWVGVQIFFVLSGFVIAYSAYASRPGHFLTQRLARLMPALLLCSTFTGIVYLIFHQYSKTRIALMWMDSVTFRPKSDLIDGSHWTLTLEMSFYLLIFGLLLVKRSHLISTALAVLGIASASMTLSLLFKNFVSPQITRFTIALFVKLPLGQGHFIRHGCYFSLGVFLWLALFRGFTWQRIAMIAVTMSGGIAEIVLRARELTHECIFPISAGVPLTVWLMALLAIVLCTRYNLWLQQKLGLRGIAVLRQLGLMTYPLYLVHQGFGKIMVLYLQPRIGDLSAFAATLAIVFGLSLALSMFIEPPLQKKLRATAPRLAPARIVPALAGQFSAVWSKAHDAAMTLHLPRNKAEVSQ